MPAASFKKVLKVSDLAPSEGTSVKVGTENVAVFNVAGEFVAISDVCPHAGGPLGAGPLDGNIVTCPWHGWQFDVKKACAVMSDEIRLPVYDVKVKDGFVYVASAPQEEKHG